MNINDITAGEIKEFLAAIGRTVAPETAHEPHPMLGRRCVIRTYSAGVHIGTVEWVNPDNSQEVKLKDALRLFGGPLANLPRLPEEPRTLRRIVRDRHAGP